MISSFFAILALLRPLAARCCFNCGYLFQAFLIIILDKVSRPVGMLILL